MQPHLRVSRANEQHSVWIMSKCTPAVITLGFKLWVWFRREGNHNIHELLKKKAGGFTFTLVVLLRAEQTQGWQGVTGERGPVRSHQAAAAVAVVMPGSATRVERWRGAVLFHSQQGGVRDRPSSNSSCKICRGEKEKGEELHHVDFEWNWSQLLNDDIFHDMCVQ